MSEFAMSLEGVKMLIRSGDEIINMELEHELDLRKRENYTVLLPWLKDSLVGSVSQVTTLFGQAVKSISAKSSMEALGSGLTGEESSKRIRMTKYEVF